MSIFGVVISEHDLYLVLSANIVGFVFGIWAEKITNHK